MHLAIYNLDIPKNRKSAYHAPRPACIRRFAYLFALLLSTAALAADWSTAEQQLAKKIVAVTGPGTVMLTVENRSSLGRRDSDIVQNGLRSALEQSGIHFAKSEQGAATVSLTLSENQTSYVWVAEVRQGAADAAVAMVSVPRSWRSGPTYESMPIAVRKVPLWTQDERMLDVAVLEENDTASRIAVLGAENVATYRLQNGKWQAEQTLAITHPRPWPLDLRGRFFPTPDHTLDAYLPGVICRITVMATPLTITCHAGDDPWPIVSGTMNVNSSVFPGAGSNNTYWAPVPPLAGFFASTRNFFTGVLSPAVGNFSAVPKFYSAAFVPREKYTLWLFAGTDGKIHLIDGTHEESSTFAWGSDIAALRTSCGAGSQVLATSGDQAPDSIRAYEFPDRDPVAVSAAIDFPGPVSALWTEARGDSGIAIARNRDTGSYEAFRLSLACGQ